MSALPEHMQVSAQRYIEHGQPPGDFLRAVLENNLAEAFGRADTENEQHMREWAQWLYMDVPHAAWGSRECVDSWVAQGGLNAREMIAKVAP